MKTLEQKQELYEVHVINKDQDGKPRLVILFEGTGTPRANAKVVKSFCIGKGWKAFIIPKS